MSNQSGSIAQKTADTLHDSARIAIPLGIALVIGVFVSLGIEGDALARLLRNSPYWVGTALVLAVLGVTLPLVLSWLPANVLRKITALSAALLLAATGVAILAGIRGVGMREEPGIDVKVLSVSKKTAIVQVDASALSLASSNRMLLRIVTFRASTPFDEAYAACGHTARDGVEVSMPTRDGDSVPVLGARIVYWGETGPSATGTAETQYAFEVHTSKTRYACAHAILSKGSDRRASTAILDLRNLGTSAE